MSMQARTASTMGAPLPSDPSSVFLNGRESLACGPPPFSRFARRCRFSARRWALRCACLDISLRSIAWRTVGLVAEAESVAWLSWWDVAGDDAVGCDADVVAALVDVLNAAVVAANDAVDRRVANGCVGGRSSGGAHEDAGH